MSDVIPVRSDERFDEQQLASYLQVYLPGFDQAVQVEQFGGGAANLTYLLHAGAHEYVLRRPPLGPLAPGAHDMAREYRVLSVLHCAFKPAPQALLFCADPDIIGAPFFVMERKHGTVIRRTLPAVFDTPTAPAQLSSALVDALADFHAVDYTTLGLDDLGRPQGFVERQIEGWYDRWNRAKIEPHPTMDWLYGWLKQQQPATQACTLVHNDYKLDNVMFAADDPAEVVAVFDWDMCTLGDPLVDLGTLLCYWSEPTDPALFQHMAMMPTDARFLGRQALVQRYAERSGRDVSAIKFYHVLGLFRLVVIIAQIYLRYHRGQTADQRFALFGQLVPVVIGAAQHVAQSVESSHM